MAKRKNIRSYDPERSYTIPEFCRAERISPSFYYRLRKNGYGPVEYCPNGAGYVRISAKSRRNWHHRMEMINANDESARAIRKKRSKNASEAGKLACAARWGKARRVTEQKEYQVKSIRPRDKRPIASDQGGRTMVTR
jgi:hypothetical protein